MPCKKRRRPATVEDDAQRLSKTHSSRRTPLASFSSLAREIRQIIVEMACVSPQSSASSPGRSPFALDIDKMFNLALVCREFNLQVTPLLWGSIAITRPSALYALHQTLQANPDRAKLIISLHIGPQDVLPSYWWPLSRTIVDAGPHTAASGQAEMNSTSHWIATSLDESLLPSGCTSREAWHWDRSTPGCRGAAVSQALGVIKAALGLNLRAHSCASPTTIAPVFEAQAALDLYLTRLRSVEEDNPVLVQMARPGAHVPLSCRDGLCRHYPPLFISDAPKSVRSGLFGARHPPPAEPPSNAFVISYTQLLCHIARPGSITDRFDHPLALARSQFNVIIDVPAERGLPATSYRPSRASYKLHSGTWDVRQHEVGQWAGHALLQEAAKQTTSDEDQKCYAATISTATFGSTLQLARSVLDAASSVENLSLTGYLESAIPGRVFNPTLTRLSLGPALPCWDAPLDLRLLDGVEELRICGRSMTFYEAGTIALKMLSLKRLVWSLTEPYATKRSQSAANVIHFLLKTHTSDPNTFIQGQSGPRSNAKTPLPPLIIVRLHPTDMVEVLRTAPSAGAKAAWLAGTEPLPFWSFPFCRKLLLKENPTAIALRASHGALPVIGSDSSSSPIWEGMYREGRSYWRDGEGEVGQIEEEKEEEEAAEGEEKKEEEEEVVEEKGDQSEEDGR